MYIGNKEVSSVFIGDKEVSGIYLGDKEIWSSGFKARFVTVGESSKSYYSLDGENWIAMSGLSGIFQSVAYGKNRFVTVGEAGKSYYCVNGETWEPMSGLSNTTFRSVTFGNNRFVAVGNDGKSYQSTDGKTWEPMSGLSGTVYSVAYGDNKFVAVGSDGIYSCSDDSINWNKNTPSTTIGGTIYSISYDKDNNVFIIGSYVRNGGGAYYSNNLTSWTDMKYPTNEKINGICYDAQSEIYVFVGSNKAYRRNSIKTSGNSWTNITNMDCSLLGVVASNGKIVAVGEDCTTYYLNGPRWVKMGGISTSSATLNGVAYGGI